MKDLIRRHRFLAFYLLAVAIVVGVMWTRWATNSAELLPNLFQFLQDNGMYANTVSIALFGAMDWRALLIFVFAGAPTYAALLISGWLDGRGGVAQLLSRFKPWRGVDRRQGSAVYLVLAGIYVVGAAAYMLFAFRSGGEAGFRDSILQGLGGSWLTAVLWLLVGPFIDEGGLWEELGWHGYGLPLLLDRMRAPLAATLSLGFLWWLWHFPREIPNLVGGNNLGTWAFNQGVFLLLCLCLSIVTTLAWFKTGGSVLPAILIHGLTNVWSKALSGPLWQATGQDVRTWAVVLAAVVVLVATRGRLGAPSNAEAWPTGVS